MISTRTISEADFYRKLGEPHNPPESNVSEEVFDAEYYRLYDRVEKVLEHCGENNAYGEGDYCLEPHISASRGLGLTITNPGIISPELFEQLGECIRDTDTRWEIYLGSDEYDFGIFISSTEVLIWKNQDSSLQA